MAGRRASNKDTLWPLEQRPGYLIRRLHQIHVALFQEKCAAFEITPLQYSLLTALAKRGTADQSTLAADIALDRTTTTGALKRLQSRHFVDRAIEHGDRRAQTCRLTKAGARAVAENGKVGAAGPSRDGGGSEQGRSEAIHCHDAEDCGGALRAGECGAARLIHPAGRSSDYILCNLPQKQLPQVTQAPTRATYPPDAKYTSHFQGPLP